MIGTEKAASDIEKHYEEVFLSSPDFLPTDKEILSKRDDRTMKLTLPKSARVEVKRGRKSKDVEQPAATATTQARKRCVI